MHQFAEHDLIYFIFLIGSQALRYEDFLISCLTFHEHFCHVNFQETTKTIDIRQKSQTTNQKVSDKK